MNYGINSHSRILYIAMKMRNLLLFATIWNGAREHKAVLQYKVKTGIKPKN